MPVKNILPQIAISARCRKRRTELVENYGDDGACEVNQSSSVCFSKRRRRETDCIKVLLIVARNRVTDKWNNLPQCCINCTTLNNFKSHIHKVLEPETKL